MVKLAVTMRLLRRAGKAKKKWRRKAWLVDPSKTKIVFVFTDKSRHVPPWVCKEPDPSMREALWMSNVRKEYGPLK